jgi:YbgC/YbaW family acyl-CoA thioester hydrolase
VNLSFPEQILFTHNLRVRTYDINKGGHLGHDRLISLLHEAREHFFFKLGFNELDIDGVGIVVADLMVQYLGEAFMAQRLEIDIAIAGVGRKSIDMYYRVKCIDNGALVALAKTAIVFFDYGPRTAVEVPPLFLQRAKERMRFAL